MLCYRKQGDVKMLTRLYVGTTYFPKCTKMNFNQLSLQQFRNNAYQNCVVFTSLLQSGKHDNTNQNLENNINILFK